MTHLPCGSGGPVRRLMQEPGVEDPRMARLQRGQSAMNEANQPSKIAFVSDYVPRRCGIATFTQDLRDAVAAQYPEASAAC